jgi:hypothetical protein
MCQRVDQRRVVAAGVSVSVNLRMKPRTRPPQQTLRGLQLPFVGEPSREKSHDGARPGPFKREEQVGIEGGIVAQRDKVFYVLTQDAEVLAWRQRAGAQIIPDPSIVGAKRTGDVARGDQLAQERVEHAQRPREPPARACDERAMQLPEKIQFELQPRRPRVEASELAIATCRFRFLGVKRSG